MYVILFAEGTSKLKEGLPVKCQVACSCAISRLEEVFKQLQEGEITIVDLQKIKDKSEQMKRLCEAASADQKKDEPERRGGEMSYDAMLEAVKQRIEEFEKFKQHKDYLLSLCQKIQPPLIGKVSSV